MYEFITDKKKESLKSERMKQKELESKLHFFFMIIRLSVKAHHLWTPDGIFLHIRY